MYSKQGGFTLIELMMVAAIIAILACIGIPSYQSYVVKAKEVKDLVINTLAHDFSERDNEHIKVASSVEQWEIFEPDESIKLASTKTERITLTIDAFKLCYLSFFLAVSIVLLSISLVYLVIYCTRQPAKEKKRKIKRGKRK